jgi:hypothetical protein
VIDSALEKRNARALEFVLAQVAERKAAPLSAAAAAASTADDSAGAVLPSSSDAASSAAADRWTGLLQAVVSPAAAPGSRARGDGDRSCAAADTAATAADTADTAADTADTAAAATADSAAAASDETMRRTAASLLAVGVPLLPAASDAIPFARAAITAYWGALDHVAIVDLSAAAAAADATTTKTAKPKAATPTTTMTTSSPASMTTRTAVVVRDWALLAVLRDLLVVACRTLEVVQVPVCDGIIDGLLSPVTARGRVVAPTGGTVPAGATTAMHSLHATAPPQALALDTAAAAAGGGFAGSATDGSADVTAANMAHLLSLVSRLVSPVATSPYLARKLAARLNARLLLPNPPPPPQRVPRPMEQDILVWSALTASPGLWEIIHGIVLGSHELSVGSSEERSEEEEEDDEEQPDRLRFFF